MLKLLGIPAILRGRGANAWVLLLVTLTLPVGADTGPVVPSAVAPQATDDATGPPSLPRPAASLDPREELPAEARRWVDERLSAMDLGQLAGQVLAIRADTAYFPVDDERRRVLVRQVEELALGGLVVFRSQPYEVSALLHHLQAAAEGAGHPPLLVGADFEWGADFRINGAIPYPTAMAVGAAGEPDDAEWMGRATGRDARALGVHWVLAPVADVNVNPRNPVINVRSFGEDPAQVAELAAAFVRGAQDGGVLATAKHFPGHGDTAVDSHLEMPVLDVDSQRLQAVELRPFRRAIDAGVGSIMTAHIAVPALTTEQAVPATLSPQILTGLLRNELGFRGLVVTDAMDMGGISRMWWGGDAAVRALAAGADMVLLPPDPAVARAAIVRAVESGQLPRARLREAAGRVLEAKARLGLTERRGLALPLEALPSHFALTADAAPVRDISERAVTLLRDRNDALPVDARRPARVLVVGISDSDSGAPIGALVDTLRSRLERVESGSIDGRTDGDEVAEILAEAARSDLVVLGVRVRVRSYAREISLPPDQQRYARLVARLDVPVVVVALGSPYAVAALPEAGAAAAVYGFSEPLQVAAARALLGEIPWRGRLPVTLPGLYRRGYGLQRPGIDAGLRWAADEPAAEGGEAADPAEEAGVEEEVSGERPEQAARPDFVHVLPPSPLRAADLEEADRALRRWIGEGAFPGAVYAVGHRNTVVRLEALGRMHAGADAPAMPVDAVFDLASLTKVVATTTVAMRAVEEGKLRLDYPVRALVPGFRGEGKDAVTVRHLLTHTSGLPAYVEFFRDFDPSQVGEGAKAEILERIYTTPLEVEPGTRTAYSDLGIILLGEVLDRALGEPYDRVARRQLFEPLGMDDTRWSPPPSWRDRIPPTERDPWRGRLVAGEVHDRNAFAMGGVAPHAGLFSTAADLSVFAQTLLNGGTYVHRRVVGRRSLDSWTRRQGVVADSSRALGWDTARPSTNWSMFSESAFGHTGFTGTSLWIDPARELFVVLLTNRVHPTRDNTLHVQARVDFHNAVVNAVDAAAGAAR